MKSGSIIASLSHFLPNSRPKIAEVNQLLLKKAKIQSNTASLGHEAEVAGDGGVDVAVHGVGPPARGVAVLLEGAQPHPRDNDLLLHLPGFRRFFEFCRCFRCPLVTSLTWPERGVEAFHKFLPSVNCKFMLLG